MSFTIQNALLPVERGDETADVPVADSCISAIGELVFLAPELPFVAERKVQTIDVDDLRRELFDRSEWNSKRQSQTVSEIEAHYHKVMKLQGY
ncbi:hypothetical protein [Oscillatoria nigro-viridis]|uniref:hypothetical protein n=1 Tax=Phormidium nigroviride TaxID=482564 RepID=UPI0002DA1516|nr:hypothetical protein [Oscillatoria nigro-viridis]